MRIRGNSKFASRHYLKEVCILNQNPRDILSSWTESQSQTDVENDEFGGRASFGSSVKDLLSGMIPTEEGKDKTENELAVYCSFTDGSGSNCGMGANAGSQYCEAHVRTCSGTSKRRAKKVINRRPKRKKEDLSPGDEIVYYAGFPGLRRKRGRPVLHRSEAAAVKNVDESH